MRTGHYWIYYQELGIGSIIKEGKGRESYTIGYLDKVHKLKNLEVRSTLEVLKHTLSFPLINLFYAKMLKMKCVGNITVFYYFHATDKFHC